MVEMLLMICVINGSKLQKVHHFNWSALASFGLVNGGPLALELNSRGSALFFRIMIVKKGENYNINFSILTEVIIQRGNLPRGKFEFF